MEVDAEGPMLLIPKHAFCPDIMGGVIGCFTVSNRFLYDGDEGTLSALYSRKEEEDGSSLPRHKSTPVLSNRRQDPTVGNDEAGLNRTISGIGLTDATPTSGTGDGMLTVEEDKRRIEGVWSTRQGPCLLDCMELLLQDVDVFSARRVPLASHTHFKPERNAYRIERDVSFYSKLRIDLYNTTQ